jgi:hypothetical protein
MPGAVHKRTVGNVTAILFNGYAQVYSPAANWRAAPMIRCFPYIAANTHPTMNDCHFRDALLKELSEMSFRS